MYKNDISFNTAFNIFPFRLNISFLSPSIYIITLLWCYVYSVNHGEKKHFITCTFRLYQQKKKIYEISFKLSNL